MSNMLLDNKTMEILNGFSLDYNKRIYGHEIARELKMNQKTVSNILKRLERENILKFSKEGRNKYYFLNRFNKQIKQIINLIELDRKLKFLRRYKKLDGLFNTLEDRAKGILIVFGSYSNFSAHEDSDLDIFVMGDISSIEDLEQMYNIKINVVKSNKKKIDKEDIFIKEIIKNHIVLKSIENFVELIWQT